jgi:hypothetical protein
LEAAAIATKMPADAIKAASHRDLLITSHDPAEQRLVASLELLETQGL